MTREEAIEILKQPDRIGCNLIKANDEESTKYNQESIEALTMAIKALEAWDKFKQALDKRVLEQGFDEDEWSVSYNELIKMMKKCGGME